MHRVLDLVLERNEELEKKQEQFTALLIQHDAELRALLEQLNATLPQIRGELDTRLAGAVPALVSEAYDGYNHELEQRCAAALSGAATKLDALRDEIAKLAAEKFSEAEKRVGVSLNEIEQRIKESVGASVELRAGDIERGLVLRIAEELAKQAPKSAQTEKPAGLVELYRGQFTAGKTAKRGEVWTYLGGTYLALEDTTEFPSRRTVGTKRAFWAILAARGGGGGSGDTLPPQAGNSGKVLGTDGSALSWVDAGSGSGDALKSDPLSQFAATTSAQLAGVLTDETGSGSAVFGTNPTIVGYNLTGARTVTATTLAGTEIDVTKPETTKAISADTTLTFSATLAEGKEFRLTLNATGGPWVVTFPSSYSPDRQANVTTVSIPSGGTVILLFRRTASRYEVFGLPPATVGSGSFVLSSYAVPSRQHFEISFDPKSVCDGAVDRLFLFTVSSTWAPNGIVLQAWRCSFEADPTTEADLDLKRADAFIGVANAAVMDVLDTTAGVASETTAANINAGATIATGKVIYLEFGTAYTEANHQIIFELEYTLA